MITNWCSVRYLHFSSPSQTNASMSSSEKASYLRNWSRTTERRPEPATNRTRQLCSDSSSYPHWRDLTETAIFGRPDSKEASTAEAGSHHPITASDAPVDIPHCAVGTGAPWGMTGTSGLAPFCSEMGVVGRISSLGSTMLTWSGRGFLGPIFPVGSQGSIIFTLMPSTPKENPSAVSWVGTQTEETPISW